MSSPIGHILGALALHQALDPLKPSDTPRGWKAVVLVSALAYAPDLDVVWGWIRAGVRHRGFTHSILFALMLAAAATFFWYGVAKGFGRWRYVGVLFLVCLVHPALDMLMKCGPDVPLFSPVSGRGFNSPVQFVPTAYYAASFSRVRAVVTYWRSWAGLGGELAIFVPLVLAAKAGRPWWLRVGLLAFSAAAVTITYLLYR